MMKFKALQDLTKSLKELGFSGFYKSLSDTIVYDFENIKLKQKIGVSELLVGGLEKTESNYYNILDRICHIKKNTSYHTDLNIDMIKKITGFLIEFFYFLRKFYNNFGESLEMYF